MDVYLTDDPERRRDGRGINVTGNGWEQMFYVGLDLGQRLDHSAIVVVERRDVVKAFLPARFDSLLVRYVERVPLGTPYPRVVARVRELVRHPDLAGQCSLVVDGTGVGAPVVEMLRAAQLGCEMTAVTITGGERQHRHYAAGGAACSVPKQDLIAGVQVLLERGELRIARKLKEAGALVRELMSVRSTRGNKGRVKIGAEGCREHDDLVIALALACWSFRRARSMHGTRRLTGI